MDHDDWWVTISFPDQMQAGRAKLMFPGTRLLRMPAVGSGAASR
jgi:hypothetical protein